MLLPIMDDPTIMAPSSQMPLLIAQSTNGNIGELLQELLLMSGYANLEGGKMLDEEIRMVEELKKKERRKCTDLLAELMVQIQEKHPLFFPESSSSQSSPFEPFSSEQVPDEKRREVSNGSAQMDHPPDWRPHKCDQCQKSFRFKSNLFEHKSLHLGSTHRNPFVCPFCAKTCRLKGNLKKHLQVHVTSVEDLERLWKRSFSRQSGRPRKNAPPAPLPKPGDDLGLVPVLVATQQKKANPGDPSPHSRHHSPNNQCPSIQWTFADQQNGAQKTMLNIEPKMKLFLMDDIFQKNVHFDHPIDKMADPSPSKLGLYVQ